MINLERVFRKRLRTELRNLGYGRIQSWKLEKGCPVEMINDAIGNFVNPKDFALAIIQ